MIINVVGNSQTLDESMYEVQLLETFAIPTSLTRSSHVSSLSKTSN
ncbi:137_t:CDS:2 [Cetraspora pellucida]|uniref:137_t:CDS:1 n=1 Tax=Cetraspora pellucida TaxID=1433469 RepID=A0A9N9F5D4_9GLOM|nr:137_t:CDS:2 [Cetraspora pellucida]